MPATLFQRVVVPVANREDARTTGDALAPHLEAGSGTVVAVHVIEKAGGAPDKASVEQREEEAIRIFEVFRETLDAPVETEIVYGTDVAAAIIDAAADLNASAIVFTPRGGSRLVRLLTGDVADSLVEATDRPVIVLPAAEREREEATD